MKQGGVSAIQIGAYKARKKSTEHGKNSRENSYHFQREHQSPKISLGNLLVFEHKAERVGHKNQSHIGHKMDLSKPHVLDMSLSAMYILNTIYVAFTI